MTLNPFLTINFIFNKLVRGLFNLYLTSPFHCLFQANKHKTKIKDRVSSEWLLHYENKKKFQILQRSLCRTEFKDFHLTPQTKHDMLVYAKKTVFKSKPLCSPHMILIKYSVQTVWKKATSTKLIPCPRTVPSVNGKREDQAEKSSYTLKVEQHYTTTASRCVNLKFPTWPAYSELNQLLRKYLTKIQLALHPNCGRCWKML